MVSSTFLWYSTYERVKPKFVIAYELLDLACYEPGVTVSTRAAPVARVARTRHGRHAPSRPVTRHAARRHPPLCSLGP